jgi:HD-GYP domain-containing protein (c-di-GMP phosphodiesterase class II)
MSVSRGSVQLAGLLHDVGAFSLDERLDLIEREPLTVNSHAFRGAKLIENFAPLSAAAKIIRHHHIPWSNGDGKSFKGEEVSFLSHILHLADRVAVLIDRDQNIIDQVERIKETIAKQRNAVFVPEFVDAFMDISVNEYIWLDTVYRPLLYILPDIVVFDTLELSTEELMELTKIFANIIDFRNPFTANHSTGVANTAQKLAELAGFSATECKMMFIAGNLHDLGKLAVSRAILDKPGKLDEGEHNVIRSHSFYTYRLLQGIKGFETINNWASFHHEKLNGNGYPFHLRGESISLGSRIVAVADIFTAITEDRPYRKGMSLDDAVAVIKAMVEDNSICSYVAAMLMDNLSMIDESRKEAQQKSKVVYNYIMRPSE